MKKIFLWACFACFLSGTALAETRPLWELREALASTVSPPAHFPYKSGILKAGDMRAAHSGTQRIEVLSGGDAHFYLFFKQNVRYLLWDHQVLELNIRDVHAGFLRQWGIYTPGEGVRYEGGRRFHVVYSEDFVNFDDLDALNQWRQLFVPEEATFYEDVTVLLARISNEKDGVFISMGVYKPLLHWQDAPKCSPPQNMTLFPVQKVESVEQELAAWRRE